MYGNNAMKRSKEAAKNRLKAEFIGSDNIRYGVDRTKTHYQTM